MLNLDERPLVMVISTYFCEFDSGRTAEFGLYLVFFVITAVFGGSTVFSSALLAALWLF